uniref:AH domain-containing protein n=1 Tax=Strigamia maritima TaxID=126957 RepID=T1IZ06_STRMM
MSRHIYVNRSIVAPLYGKSYSGALRRHHAAKAWSTNQKRENMANTVINDVGSVMDPDKFERDLQEILNDGPNMNDSEATVHSGSNSPTRNRPPVYPISNRQLPVPTSLPAPINTPGEKTVALPPISSLLYTTFAPCASPDDMEGMNSTVSLTSPSPSQYGDPKLMKPSQSKIDSIKQWSISTYKCTRQIISERLGKTSRTVDTELEGQIDSLRDTQRKYANILRLARALTSHFYHVVQTQVALGDSFADLAQKSPELQEEFMYNAETQRSLTKNGETLLGALNFFVSSVNTLCNKTMEDTLVTIKQYEAARVEYDAYRTDLEALTLSPAGDGQGRVDDAQRNFNIHKEKFDRLRSDVQVKLKFLEENKVKVMHKQLLLFHNAISAYFSGNQNALETTLKQFNIKVKTPNSTGPSWLEQ